MSTEVQNRGIISSLVERTNVLRKLLKIKLFPCRGDSKFLLSCDRQRYRQTDRQTYGQSYLVAGTACGCPGTHPQTVTHTHRQTDRQVDRRTVLPRCWNSLRVSGGTSSSTPSSSDTSMWGEMSSGTSCGLLVPVPNTRGPGVPSGQALQND